MEHIKDSFRVENALDDTWNTLLDIERIAPCMPGAQLQEVEGDVYRGVVKIKVGPIQAHYKGTAKLAMVDRDSRTIKIDASGRDTRGQGNASAIITVTMAGDDSHTVVEIDTEVNVTGKVAQFGRGEMPKISAKLLKQFVASLEADILNAPVVATESVADTEAAAALVIPISGVRKIDAPEAAPINLLETAGSSIIKIALPVAGVIAVIIWLLIRRN